MTVDYGAGVTEVGEFLVSLSSALPKKTRNELVRMLGHSVALPTAAELREARLGLLVTMMGGGRIPTSTEYNLERSARAELSEKWPSHANLVLHFGTWARAAQAALDLHFSITKRRDKARPPQAWPAKPYKRPEILGALETSSEKVGRLITQWEYAELRRVERHLAFHRGLRDPRLPSLNVIKRNLGGWDQAITKVNWR
ncbi:MAG: hypothetical protein IPK93_04550 [Solirubrobacterales bacterium]|nr:hypothetical protein [Solirubrobacterales bacterium]